MERLTFRPWLIMSSISQRFPERNSESVYLLEVGRHKTCFRSVGIGSDYDGIGRTPKGLEDVSKYPALVGLFPCALVAILAHRQVAELYRRGWDKYELAGLTGGNLLRVFAAVENVSRELQAAGSPAVYDIYDKRKDMPINRQEL